jgi:hypothetical protein
MLDQLKDGPGQRKLRFIAIASCNRILPLISDVHREAFHTTVARAESVAEGHVTSAQVADLFVAGKVGPSVWELTIASHCCHPQPRWAARRAVISVSRYVERHSTEGKTARRDELRILTDIIRCVLGNPFKRVALSPDWRTDTAVSLAHHMYESRDFSAMPILADALQDAGCDNEDILAHCRQPGEHVRGCWVVDLVLGKS